MAKNTEKETAPAPDNVFKMGKVQYEVLSGAIVPGLGQFTAGEIAVDEEVQKAILAIPGQNIIRELA